MDINFNNINTLVIDTNSSMRQIMVSMLRAMGIKTVIVANSDKQCFELIASQKINLIICGWTMPKLNALAMLKKLRNDDKTIKTPFIIVSTIIEQELIKQAILNGVSEYLVPPFNKQIFESRIHKALKIPVRLSATNVTEKMNANRFPHKKKRAELDVLIVDDVADNIEIIRGIIKDKYNVKAAINAQIAMKICLSDSPPDLILLDIMMPEVDGLTLCKELKQNPMTQNIVIIFLSALSENKDVVKGLSLGAVDYITKPVTPSILLARLNVHTKLIINQRAIQQQIDSLVEQSATYDKFNQLIQSDLQSYMASGTAALSEIERQTSSNKQLHPLLSELKYNVGISELLLDKVSVLEQLENNSYKENKTRKEISNILLPVMNIFDFAISEKNVERFENIAYNTQITCDERLLKVLFTSLYRNALEAAPRGSKVSVESKRYDEFCLIKIHNVRTISPDVIDNFDQLFVSSEDKNGTGIGVYLAFLVVEKLQGNLYFHSSEKYGTTFYVKLPFALAKK